MLSKLSYASTTLIIKLYCFKISLLLKIKKKVFYSFEKFQLIKEISKQIELDILQKLPFLSSALFMKIIINHCSRWRNT